MSSFHPNEETSTLSNKFVKMKIKEKITPKKMRCLVREFGCFPGENRPLVWGTLLQLPHNHSSFRSLVINSMDTELPSLWTDWISQRDLLCPNTILQLNRSLRWLITWSPELSCLDFLPQFVLPFASLLGNDPVSCFEAIVSAIINWGGMWLEMCSEPPFQLMTLMEELLLKFGPGALKILKQQSISIVSFAWPLFETGFASVLEEKNWRQLWDHIVCNKPAFYISVGVAVVCCTELLLRQQASASKEIKDLLCQKLELDMKVLLRKSYEIYDFVSNWPPILLCELKLLSEGTYSTLEQLMDKKPEVSRMSQQREKPERYTSGSSSLVEEEKLAETDDVSSEIMNALAFSHRVREAVESVKGAQLTEHEEIKTKKLKKKSNK